MERLNLRFIKDRTIKFERLKIHVKFDKNSKYKNLNWSFNLYKIVLYRICKGQKSFKLFRAVNIIIPALLIEDKCFIFISRRQKETCLVLSLRERYEWTKITFE